MPSPSTASKAGRARARRRALARLMALQTFAIGGFFITSCNSSVPLPSVDISSGQAMLDLGNALAQLREDNAMLQAQIDSLRFVVAYQDTIVRQLAALSNVSMRAASSPVY